MYYLSFLFVKDYDTMDLESNKSDVKENDNIDQMKDIEPDPDSEPEKEREKERLLNQAREEFERKLRVCNVTTKGRGLMCHFGSVF